MNARPDIVVRDRFGGAVRAVEVKARRGVDESWAAQLRRNLRAHDLGLMAAYFMIVTSNDVYLWHQRQRDEDLTVRSPDASAGLRDLVGDTAAFGDLDGRTLELIVQSWLASVARLDDASELSTTARHLLVDSGLFDELHGSVVEFEPV